MWNGLSLKAYSASTSHHITSHHITSRHITSQHITSHHGTPWHGTTRRTSHVCGWHTVPTCTTLCGVAEKQVCSRWMSSPALSTTTAQRHPFSIQPLNKTQIKQPIPQSTFDATLQYCFHYTIPCHTNNTYVLYCVLYIVYMYKAHLIGLAFMALDVLLQVVFHTERLCAAGVGAPAATHSQQHIVNNTPWSTQSGGWHNAHTIRLTAQQVSTMHARVLYSHTNASKATASTTCLGCQQAPYTTTLQHLASASRVNVCPWGNISEAGASHLAVAWTVKGSSLPARNGLKTLPKFQPVSGLLQGEDWSRTF